MAIRHFLPRLSAATALGAAALTVTLQAEALAQAPACSVHSPATMTRLVELYTSEGCSSCPPADRWLARLKAEPDTVALAFHVDYWDRLGWKDRFASAGFTQRQAQSQRSSGARFSYTPQVIVDGADRTDWQSLTAPIAARDRPAAPGAVALMKDGGRFMATVAPAAGAPARLAAYWAVTEQGHVSTVKAGENEGATLRHDFVVREYRPVGAWSADTAVPTTLSFEPAAPADPAHPREVSLVVIGAESGRPLQAVKLGC